MQYHLEQSHGVWQGRSGGGFGAVQLLLLVAIQFSILWFN